MALLSRSCMSVIHWPTLVDRSIRTRRGTSASVGPTKSSTPATGMSRPLRISPKITSLDDEYVDTISAHAALRNDAAVRSDPLGLLNRTDRSTRPAAWTLFPGCGSLGK